LNAQPLRRQIPERSAIPAVNTIGVQSTSWTSRRFASCRDLNDNQAFIMLDAFQLQSMLVGQQ
jgi:hypothetical protein